MVQTVRTDPVGAARTPGRHRVERVPAPPRPTPDPHGPARPAHPATHRRRRLVSSSGFLALAALATAAVVAVGGWLVAAGPAPEPVGTGDTGGGAPRPHERATVAIAADGGVHVELDLAWPAERTDVEVAVPERAGSDFRPVVAVAPSAPDAREARLRAGDVARLPVDGEATRLTVGYRADGTFAASVPSVAGRGLVLLTPLRVEEPDVPIRVTVTDPRILNLACVSPDSTRSCGSRAGSAWTVTDVLPSEDVVAQVTLGADPAGRP